MKKKFVWLVVSCLMVVALLSASCASTSAPKPGSVEAEVEAFARQFLEAAVAKDIDYLSDLWYTGPKAAMAGQPAEGLISWDAHYEGYQGIETICVEVYKGEVWTPMRTQGGIEHEPVPGLQGDTATYEGKLIYPSGARVPEGSSELEGRRWESTDEAIRAIEFYLTLHLFKLEGKWIIWQHSWPSASRGCP